MEFLFLWATIIASSYILLAMEPSSKGGAFKFAVVQLIGFMLLASGFAMAARGYPYEPISNLYYGSADMAIPIYFIFAGFMVSVGAGGFHVWFRDVSSGSPRGVLAVLTGIASKGGIFGIMLFALIAGGRFAGGNVYYILGWIGAITALFATFSALFQREMKPSLGFMSLGITGNILLGISAMNQGGWVSAMFLSIAHLLIIAILFFASGKRYSDLQEKKGKFEKIAVSIALLALAGIPPLSGYMGNLFLYEALIQKGWFIQTAFLFAASICAVIFAFRYATGLFACGDVEEIPANKQSRVFPQIAFALAIIALPVFHRQVISALMYSVPVHFPQMLLNGYADIPSIFFGTRMALVLALTPIALSIPLLMLIAAKKEGRWTKIFGNILGVQRESIANTPTGLEKFAKRIQMPYIELLWRKSFAGAYRGAVLLSRVYTGNGQTYLIYIVLLVAVLYAIAGGFACSGIFT